VTSFADRVRRERARDVLLVRINHSADGPAWYYLLVDPGKKAAFRRAVNGSDGFDLTDYGRVVASGHGTDPPAAVRERMKTEYGFTG
jgi:hypothetical protein